VSSVGRLYSLQKSVIMLLTMKNVTQDVIFASEMLKIKMINGRWARTTYFFIFLAREVIYLGKF
jgi:hypothetical protein